jgi:hypothetical protein
MRARRHQRSGELADHNFHRLAHLREPALARRQPRLAAPSRSLVTFLSRFHGLPGLDSLSTNRIAHRLTRCSLSLPRASDEAHDPRPKFACGSPQLSVLNPPGLSSAGTTFELRSPESARIDHTCTPGLGIGHRIGGPLPDDRRHNSSSSPPRRASDNPTQLPRDQDVEMRRVDASSRLAVVENVLRSL